jgi:hypothetical protein
MDIARTFPMPRSMPSGDLRGAPAHSRQRPQARPGGQHVRLGLQGHLGDLRLLDPQREVAVLRVGVNEMYRLDITADLNDEDLTGYVWTFLAERLLGSFRLRRHGNGRRLA